MNSGGARAGVGAAGATAAVSFGSEGAGTGTGAEAGGGTGTAVSIGGARAGLGAAGATFLPNARPDYCFNRGNQPSGKAASITDEILLADRTHYAGHWSAVIRR